MSARRVMCWEAQGEVPFEDFLTKGLRAGLVTHPDEMASRVAEAWADLNLTILNYRKGERK